jgi:hypothetical protein
VNQLRIGVLLTTALVVLLAPGLVEAKDPDCTGADRWPVASALVHLKNAGITDNARLDLTKTRVARLASEKIDKDLYRQVHLIDFTEKTGRLIQIVTSSDASSEECSMSGVQVFIVSSRLGIQ